MKQLFFDLLLFCSFLLANGKNFEQSLKDTQAQSWGKSVFLLSVLLCFMQSVAYFSD